MEILKSLVRSFPAPSQLESSISFYERLFKEPCKTRFSYPALGLELAQIGSVLLISGEEADLESFRATAMTLLVDDIEAFHHAFVEQGMEIISPIKNVPTGKNMRVRHPDGLIVEYVQHLAEPLPSQV